MHTIYLLICYMQSKKHANLYLFLSVLIRFFSMQGLSLRFYCRVDNGSLINNQLLTELTSIRYPLEFIWIQILVGRARLTILPKKKNQKKYGYSL